MAGLIAALAVLWPSAVAQTQECTEAYFTSAMPPAIELFEQGKLEEARTAVEPVLAACDTHPAGGMPRVLLADIAVRLDDPQRALDLLKDVDSATVESYGSLTHWLKLRSLKSLQRTEEFLASRAELVALVTNRLSAPDNPASAKLEETWETADATISAFSLNLLQGPFLRRHYFLIVPKDDGMPSSIMITNSPAASLLGLDRGPAQLAVDFYDCGGHATLDWVRARGRGAEATLRYRDARKIADKALSGDTNPVSSTSDNDGGCQFAEYITPLNLEP